MKGQSEAWEQLTHYERAVWQQPYQRIGGVDEVGRGPLAGPVVAAAVILRADTPIWGVDDSKKLTARQRLHLYHEIVRCAEDVGVGMVGVRTIERINILQASRLAMMRAIGHLRRVPDVLLTDAMRIGGPWQEIPIVHGDALSASIAAASIVAKVVRDRYMEALAEQFPVYGFAQHKGYPTTYHREMLKHYGPSPVHRVTFLKKILSHDAIG
ncbi:ribonuclease HII [Sulfobacillus sp. hq2]|uniref:ribonuclease HII n=1 Tax=Sulfobacillus TaxID=28033 RepID=UPI000CD24A6E|nr:ribonuclease HII [Sulfobacillus sp. hq2]POB09160.1 ribonuclease HII [Sulfobacillus sp. hq2]